MYACAIGSVPQPRCTCGVPHLTPLCTPGLFRSYVGGFFSFAILLSVVGESVQQRFEWLRSGKFPVRSSDHLVLLGWNDTVSVAGAPALSLFVLKACK